MPTEGLSSLDFMKDSKWGMEGDHCAPKSIVIDFREGYFFMPQEVFRDEPVKILAVDDRDPTFVLTVWVPPDPQQYQVVIIK